MSSAAESDEAVGKQRVVYGNAWIVAKDRVCIPVRKPVPDAFVPSWQAPETERLAFTPAEMAQQKHAIRRPDVKAVNNVKIGD